MRAPTISKVMSLSSVILTDVSVEDHLGLVSCILHKRVYHLSAEQLVSSDTLIWHVVGPGDQEGAQITHEIVKPFTSVVLLNDVVCNRLKPMLSIGSEKSGTISQLK